MSIKKPRGDADNTKDDGPKKKIAGGRTKTRGKVAGVVPETVAPDTAPEAVTAPKKKIVKGLAKTRTQVADLAPEAMETLETADTVIVVRSNDLFDKYLPRVTEMLRKSGKKVFVQAFPAGADAHKDIRVWMTEKNDTLAKKKLIVDRTSTHQTILRGINLDDLFGNASVTAHFGISPRALSSCGPRGIRSSEQEGDRLKMVIEMFAAVMKTIAAKKPDAVFVMSSGLMGDHFSLKNGGADYPDYGAEVADAYRTIAPGQTPSMGREEKVERKEKADLWATKKLLDGLELAGIPADRIVVLPSRCYMGQYGASSSVDRSKMDALKGRYIIGLEDRHWNGTGGFPEKCNLHLRLPLENLIEDVTAKGLVDMSQDDYEPKFEAALADELEAAMKN